MTPDDDEGEQGPDGQGRNKCLLCQNWSVLAGQIHADEDYICEECLAMAMEKLSKRIDRYEEALAKSKWLRLKRDLSTFWTRHPLRFAVIFSVALLAASLLSGVVISHLNW